MTRDLEEAAVLAAGFVFCVSPLAAAVPSHHPNVARTGKTAKHSTKKQVPAAAPKKARHVIRQNGAGTVVVERVAVQVPEVYGPFLPLEEFNYPEAPCPEYDAILAFDPDWTLLSEEQLRLVARWVDKGGGLVAVGGPINTLQLARPGANRDKLKPILDLYPVILKDIRIEELDRTATESSRARRKPLSGWQEYAHALLLTNEESFVN